ncbi:MAG: NUDIX hydrolase [Magnetococcales bacterium]|nr:NUDIX hydrolase [Magnetococcales bacterium]
MADHPDHWYQQSAVIPFRISDDGSLEVMLITSRKKKRWVIPKGIIEPDMSPPASAAKEAEEEAGIRGHVYPDLLGTFTYDKWGGTCTCQVYVMRVEEVMEQWLENFRDREWVDLETAAQRMKENEMQNIMRSMTSFKT